MSAAHLQRLLAKAKSRATAPGRRVTQQHDLQKSMYKRVHKCINRVTTHGLSQGKGSE